MFFYVHSRTPCSFLFISMALSFRATATNRTNPGTLFVPKNAPREDERTSSTSASVVSKESGRSLLRDEPIPLLPEVVKLEATKVDVPFGTTGCFWCFDTDIQFKRKTHGVAIKGISSIAHQHSAFVCFWRSSKSPCWSGSCGQRAASLGRRVESLCGCFSG